MTQHSISRLNSELAEMRKFVALLEVEQQSLLANDTDRLIEISENKSRSATLLNDMGDTRRRSLLEGNIRTMEDWMEMNAPGEIRIWEEIRQLAGRAQQLNLTNGELIQSKMRSNQQALNVLFRDSNHTPGVYGPNGQANIQSGGRHLGIG